MSAHSIVDEVTDLDARHIRTPYTDPRQIRLVEIIEEMARLRSEQQRLKQELQEGACEHCGFIFKRLRSTKRYCSQKCLTASSISRRSNVDLDLIRRHLPALSASHLLGPSTVHAIRHILDGRNTHETAVYVALSHQRVSQMLHRTEKLARGLEAIRLSGGL